MRLRQIALVAKDLETARADIAAVLGLAYAYQDPGVGKYGLHNVVFPVGTTFLEVVSPMTEGTTAGRLLDKRGGDGGYMVILQADDLAQARARVLAAGARIVDQFDGDGFAFTHLHPRDVGGAILSIDGMEPPERWEWGGPDWQKHTGGERGLAIVGAEYILRWLPVGTHRWDKFVTPTELEIALEKSGLSFVHEQGVVYNLIADRWQLSSDIDVNYMMTASR